MHENCLMIALDNLVPDQDNMHCVVDDLATIGARIVGLETLGNRAMAIVQCDSADTLRKRAAEGIAKRNKIKLKLYQECTA